MLTWALIQRLLVFQHFKDRIYENKNIDPSFLKQILTIYLKPYLLIIIITMQTPLQIDQVFKIVPYQAQHLCVDASGQPGQQRKLILYQFGNQPNQLWRKIRVKDNIYRLQSVQGNEDHYASINQEKDTEQVRLYKDNEVVEKLHIQQWVIIKLSEGCYSIRVHKQGNPGKAWNVNTSNLNRGESIILYSYYGGNSDRWNIIEM